VVEKKRDEMGWTCSSKRETNACRILVANFWGSEGIAPRTYPWRYMEVNAQLQASAALLPGKEPPVPTG
jgi:hypothetical protein